MALSRLNALASPLDDQQLVDLQRVLTDLSSEQVAWVSGYLAGLGGGLAPAAASQTAMPRRLTILYGSQTGNARSVADSLGERALAQGFDAGVLSMADFKPRDLAKELAILVVVSTQGEGEPPESALDLYSFLNGKRAQRLEDLRYAVLGLGDSSYELFCQAAVDFDERLAALGAQRLAPLQCCDIVYEEEAKSWSAKVLARVGDLMTERGAEIVALPGVRLGSAAKYDKDTPYVATLLEKHCITTDDAVAVVSHVVLRIDPAALRFEPGDSLGVRFRNSSELIDEILAATGADGAESVVLASGEPMDLRRALSERLELTQLHPAVAEAWAYLVGSERLKELSKDAAELRAYAGERQLIDLLADYPGRVDAASLAGLLHPLRPRLYSIASSQAEIEDEVHLTVSRVSYEAHGRAHSGAASGYLSERLAEEDPLDIYVVENPAFRLPKDGNVPLILIGAGTGIAPYRAFLQQRAANGDRGRNWLIFGNRHFHRDFLYQLDWQAYRKGGLLDRVSLAFSRDGKDKRYVQHRLQEEGTEILRWLNDGAHVYVCGSTRMGQEVQGALVDLIGRGAGLDVEVAAEFLDNLRQEGRYRRDLY
jgi:sulfite reductase (NADPH) flavoprotein alpha-component